MDSATTQTLPGLRPPHTLLMFNQTSDNASASTLNNSSRDGISKGGSAKEKRFPCSFCGKAFSFPKQVEIHQRMHTGEKPFSCHLCRASFSDSSNLKRHQRVHTGEKPHSCPQCEKRFSRQDQLKMHLKVHTGERPFACTHCGKRFLERSYLRIHQKKMHTAYVYGTSTQHVIVIESADAEAAGPGVKQERSEGEEDPRNSRDIHSGADGAHLEATEDPTPASAQPRTRRSITEVSGTPNAVLKSETDTKTLTVTHRLLHTGSDHRSDPERLGLGSLGCPRAPGSEYLPVFHQSQRTVHSCGDGDALHTAGDDPSCSYATEMDPGNMSLGLETQTDLSRGDWNRHSSSVYSEGCPEKKEVILADEVTVKMEGDAPPSWNADSHLGDAHSQGRDFLGYRESLETNPNVATHSPLHAFKDCDPVSTLMAPSDSHGRVLFDQVLNPNDNARAQAQGGGATSANSKEKRFLCMFCNKGFSSSQKVERHQRVHTGEKPYSCNQCEKRFSRQDTLKRHQRIHTGEKPYSCSLCHMRFAQTGQLKMHWKVHTGERPFACTHCGKRFSERSYLRIHQQKKHSTL
ncbi:gastrula zinc finger protein xFG20-1-like [Coregonus clupeaformis]|uniref:gastrula zinc finger protein xFG20-1-like n=1 Tax=Coregonus clupeaformis TaxID=59861 RepID=UPI001E1C6283|nr:gastrula zinc finger protein xFG20-1-like [Coregonus clupeaformis]